MYKSDQNDGNNDVRRTIKMLKCLTAKKPCETCGKPVEAIDIFPAGNCLDCHDRKHRNDPPEFPDFTKAINA